MTTETLVPDAAASVPAKKMESWADSLPDSFASSEASMASVPASNSAVSMKEPDSKDLATVSDSRDANDAQSRTLQVDDSHSEGPTSSDLRRETTPEAPTPAMNVWKVRMAQMKATSSPLPTSASGPPFANPVNSINSINASNNVDERKRDDRKTSRRDRRERKAEGSTNGDGAKKKAVVITSTIPLTPSTQSTQSTPAQSLDDDFIPVSHGRKHKAKPSAPQTLLGSQKENRRDVRSQSANSSLRVPGDHHHASQQPKRPSDRAPIRKDELRKDAKPVIVSVSAAVTPHSETLALNPAAVPSSSDDVLPPMESIKSEHLLARYPKDLSVDENAKLVKKVLERGAAAKVHDRSLFFFFEAPLLLPIS